MRKLYTVAEMTVREMSRRRGVLTLLLGLPLAFYAIRRTDHTGQSIRALFLGLSWAVSTAALFASTAARDIEPRLRLAGYRSHQLYLGRLLALLLLGFALAATLMVLVAVDQRPAHPYLGALALGMAFCVLVGAPFGLLIAALVPRELEGTLLLLMVVGVQMTIDPASAAAHLTPLWSSREIGTYAVAHTDVGYLTRGVAHGIAYTAALVLLVAVLSGVRLRTRAHMRTASGA